MAGPTNLLNIKDFELDLEPDCEVWIEINLTQEEINYFIRDNLSLDYKWLWTEDFNSNAPIYTNYWNIVENTDYVY